MSTDRGSAGEAMNHQSNGLDTNAPSQMSTCLAWAEMTRWVIEAKRVQRECSVADVNALKPAEATRWVAEATDSTRMLYRRCQRVETGRGGAMDRRGNGVSANALSQMSTR